MIAETYKDIVKRLNSAYGILWEEESQGAWWYYLKQYEDEDVLKAVDDYVRLNSRRPTPADIISLTEHYRDARKLKSLNDNFRDVSTVKCPYCQDTGWVITTMPTGIEVGTACTECSVGRERLPWFFLTEEEKDAWFLEEAKQKRHPCRNPMRASDEYYRRACYGEATA